MNTPSLRLSLVVQVVTLVLGLPVFAESPELEKCYSDAKKGIEDCDKAKQAADTAAGTEGIIASSELKGAGQSRSGGGQAGVTADGAKFLRNGSAACEKAKKLCAPSCDKVTKPEEKRTAESNKKNCQNLVNENIGRMNNLAQSLDQASGKSTETKEAANSSPSGQQGGGGAPPGGASAPPPSNADKSKTQTPEDPSKKTELPKPDAAKPPTAAGEPNCEAPSGLTEQQKTDCKAKFVDASGNCKPDASQNQCNQWKQQSFCAQSSNSSCASCKGMTAQSVASASSSDLQAICSCPNDITLGPYVADACRKLEAGKMGAQSIPGAPAAPAAAGGGAGGGSALGGAAATQSLVDADKLINAAGQQISREGGAGPKLESGEGSGFSGYGDGHGASSEESLIGMNGMKTQSVNGRNVAAAPIAANATDVEKRYGPNVCTIVSDLLKNKCAEGRFMHCEPTR